MSESNEKIDRETPFQRGHVVWVEWMDHKESRPFLVLGREPQSENGVVYVVVPLSTAEQDHSIRIEPEAWETGGVDEPSFALFWRLQSIRHAEIDRGIGALATEIVDEISRSATSFLEPAT